MKTLERITTLAKDLNKVEEQSSLILGYTHSLNYKAVGRFARLIFTNIWIQLKGLALIVSQKNLLLEINDTGVCFHRLNRGTCNFSKKEALVFQWEEIQNIEMYKTTIGNDCALKFHFKLGSSLEFEFNIKNQQTDANSIKKTIKDKLDINIGQLQLRVL